MPDLPDAARLDDLTARLRDHGYDVCLEAADTIDLLRTHATPTTGESGFSEPSEPVEVPPSQ